MKLINIPITTRIRPCTLGKVTTATLAAILGVLPATASSFSSNVSTADELEYGAILFDYHQSDYFSALIEQEYAQAIGNPKALSSAGQLFKGGMLLSYGLADESQAMFNNLLETNAPQDVQNRAWFYLAKLHYSKSDTESALAAIERVQGDMPRDLLTDYRYLATIIETQANPLEADAGQLEITPDGSPYFPYLLFNAAIAHLSAGNLVSAVENLERVTAYSASGDELAVLADRARLALADLAMRNGRLAQAWSYLSNIRTTGLYSNRALLSYVWAAINQENFHQAIPALEMLNKRSIALPEVQEAKVLLAHVYEQAGENRKALQRNIMAEKEFAKGLNAIAEARRIIDGQDVPREFVSNLEIIMDHTDWYSSRPSVDYQKLTPFLVDLMASNAFTEALRELADLYVIEDNLRYWSSQAEQHELILKASANKTLTDNVAWALANSEQLREAYVTRIDEIRIYSLVVEDEERDRLTALMDTTASQLALLDSTVDRLSQLDKPYEQPAHLNETVQDGHTRINKLLSRTRQQIVALEQIMRRLINVELDKHEDRMNHYSAQSRLAKARLYDMALLTGESTASSEEKEPVSGEQE